MEPKLNWFKRGTRWFRPRTDITADALEVAVMEIQLAPQLCDYIDTEIVRVTVHVERFGEEAITKTVADLFISLCRFLGIEKSHICLEQHGTEEGGNFDSNAIRPLIHRVLAFAGENLVPNLQNVFLEKLKFSAETVRNGGGGLGTYARSTSRAFTGSPSPNPTQGRQEYRPEPQPEPQHQPKPQQQHQQPAEDTETVALRNEVASLKQQLRAMSENTSPTRTDAVTALMIDKNATWISTDSPLFAAVFEPHTGILGLVPPMSVPMEYKAELLNALAILTNLATVAAIATGVRTEWMTYVASQLPEGQSISTAESFSITAGPLIETLLLLMRFAFEKGIAGAKSGNTPKSFAHHNLIKLARVAHGNTMSVTVFKDVWNGKSVFTVVNGAQCLLRLN